MTENSDYRHEVFKYTALHKKKPLCAFYRQCNKFQALERFSTARRKTRTCGTAYQNKGQYYNALMRELL